MDRSEFFRETKAPPATRTTLADLAVQQQQQQQQKMMTTSVAAVDSSLSSVGSELHAGGIASSRVAGGSVGGAGRSIPHHNTFSGGTGVQQQEQKHHRRGRSPGQSKQDGARGAGGGQALWHFGSGREQQQQRSRSSSAGRILSSAVPAGYYTTGRPGLRYAAIPTVPGQAAATAVPPAPQQQQQQQQQLGLKVSLPREENRQQQESDSPVVAASTRDSYGSIPHLDASPRQRLRHQSSSEQQFRYDAPAGTRFTLAVANTNQVASSCPTGGNHPPKLPEKPRQRHRHAAGASPPPLPPKKPAQGGGYRESPVGSASPVPLQQTMLAGSEMAAGRDDIYDFPPDPTIAGAASREEANRCITDILQQQQQQQQRPQSEHKQQELSRLSLIELAQMSIVELNQKMESGQLPQELRHMSIFELVEHIAEKRKSAQARRPSGNKSQTQQQQQQQQPSSQQIPVAPTSEMKPSFSDNFVSESAASPSANPAIVNPDLDRLHHGYKPGRDGEGGSVADSLSPGPPSALPADREERDLSSSGGVNIFEFEEELLRGRDLPAPEPVTNESLIKKLQTLKKKKKDILVPETVVPPTADRAATALSTSSASGGFEDNFTSSGGMSVPQPQQTAVAPGSSVASTVDEDDEDAKATSGDRYAVLRELQMEDDLIRAWKSPSDDDEEEEDGEGEQKEGEEDKNQEDEEIFHQETEEVAVDEAVKEDYEDEDEEGNREVGEVLEESAGQYYKPRVCSSEGSPCSRSDSDLDNKSVASEANEDDVVVVTGEEASMGQRDSQVPLCQAAELSRAGSQKSTAKEEANKEDGDDFESAFGPSSGELQSKSWATFDEGPKVDSGSSKRSSGRRRPPAHVSRLKSEDGADCESDLELHQYSQSQAFGDKSHAGRRAGGGAQSSMDLPYSHSSNPFGQDNFTPPVNAPENGNVEEEEDVFSSDQILDEGGFKVRAKECGGEQEGDGVPKSDSVNIFTIKDDPFDDDFFQ